MKNIDFLPTRYRERTQLRRVMVWRVAAISCLGLLIVVAQVGQMAVRRSASKQLAAIESQYIEALGTSARIKQLQTDLSANETYAELYTYLQHPWPTTQLIAAISQTLPESMTLTEIRFVRQAAANTSVTNTSVTSAESTTSPTPTNDLRTLRAEMDSTKLVVTVHGRTTDVSALQQYVRGFQQSAYFGSAKLESLESLEDLQNSPPTSRFEMHLEVRPGFGQPGGPGVEHASQDLRDREVHRT